MIEIIAMVVIFLMMAKGKPRRGRRSMGRYLRGNVDESLNLGTLAALTLVGVNFDEASEEQKWVSSVVAQWSMTLLTPTAGMGPIMVGLAHSDYTDAEVEAWIETTGSWDRGNLAEQEISQRKIRRVGTFQAEGGAVATDILTLNGGRPIKTKLGWNLVTGATVKMWAYNTGPTALATTIPIVRLQGHANLWDR